MTTRRLVARRDDARAALGGARSCTSTPTSHEARRRASYLWVTGQSWRYLSGRDAAWLAIRPRDGVVRSVEGEAELVE